MKIYVVYFRTMVDSPDVEIKCVTTSKIIAEQALTRAQREAEEWMADEDEDSGNWAEACAKVFDGVSVEKEAFVVVMNEWCEEVITSIFLFASRAEAQGWVDSYKHAVLERGFDLKPFDEEETIEESMHLCDPSFMIDYYFSIESVIVE